MTHKRSIKRDKATFMMPNLSEPHWVVLRLILDNVENQSIDWHRAIKMLKDTYGNDTVANATLMLLDEKYGAEYL